MKKILAALLIFLAIAYVVYLFIPKTENRVVDANMFSYSGLVFIKGIQGGENLYLEPNTLRIFVTDLFGSIHLIDGRTRKSLHLVESKVIAERNALGIGEGPDGFLYVAAADDDWQTTGAQILRIDKEFKNINQITTNYIGINGLCFDDKASLFFTSGRLTPLIPKGKIYEIKVSSSGTSTRPTPIFENVQAPNGICYNNLKNVLVFSETFHGISEYSPVTKTVNTIYRNSKLLEFFDDLCIDKEGNYWMTDPGRSFIKCYDPVKKLLTRYKIDGIGQTSSCRIREEFGEEILYVTELKRSNRRFLSKNYDGRGVISIPVRELRNK
jgi:sugar lactone lactonase YvrE